MSWLVNDLYIIYLYIINNSNSNTVDTVDNFIYLSKLERLNEYWLGYILQPWTEKVK